jgi:hypothetical protein
MTDYHQKVGDLLIDLIEHGYGEIKIIAETNREGIIKLVLVFGKSYVYFIKKDLKLDREDIF